MGVNVAVRYGLMRHAKKYRTNLESVKVGERVIVRTDRGTELGEVVKTRLPDDQIREKFEFYRIAGADDLARVDLLEQKNVPEEKKFCIERIAQHGLPMKLVLVEHIYGGEKIIFYFLSEGRVDFRELVKDLARQFRTRIEMHQIGVRDEARLLGDIQICGQHLCCQRWIKKFEPITMKMVKNQKSTLDPAKSSGLCGRLMCCLRYEDHVYAELRERLPDRGSAVMTVDGKLLQVIGTATLLQAVRGITPGGEIVTIDVGEIKEAVPVGDFHAAQQEVERLAQSSGRGGRDAARQGPRQPQGVRSGRPAPDRPARNPIPQSSTPPERREVREPREPVAGENGDEQSQRSRRKRRRKKRRRPDENGNILDAPPPRDDREES